ncbi:MAG: hypothetical protein ABGY42_16710 [bacterium]
MVATLVAQSAEAALSEADQACRFVQNKNMQKTFRVMGRAMAKCHRLRNVALVHESYSFSRSFVDRKATRNTKVS